MKDVNSYWRQLDQDEIAVGKHREMVGGLWTEIGKLQFEFLQRQGLLPEHRFLDVGCGCLRGGIHFIRYLDAGHYYGLDINASLIESGKSELRLADLVDKQPNLLVNDKFEFSQYGATFDFALALSVFTHLYMNHIERCLVEVKQVLKPQGRFYATIFSAPHPACLADLTHQPGGVTTHYDADPFHCAFEEMQALAGNAGLMAEWIGEWNHPRAQQMLCFRHKELALPK